MCHAPQTQDVSLGVAVREENIKHLPGKSLLEAAISRTGERSKIGRSKPGGLDQISRS